MRKCLMIAFSEPAEGREAEFERWYDDVHAPQVLETPGFVAVQIFRFEALEGMSRSKFRYLALYQLETDDLTATQAALAGRTPDFTPFDGMAVRPATIFYDPLTDRRS